MELKDFVKELAIKLNKENVFEYKQKAASLVMDEEMPIKDLVKIINSSIYYDDVLNMFNNKKEMIDAVKRVMTETNDLLISAREFYLKNKRSFVWLNDETKKYLANPKILLTHHMTDKVFDYFINNTNSSIYTDSSKNNLLYNIFNSNDKKRVTAVVNHKNFKLIPSYPPLVSLLTTTGYETLLTKTTFNKVLTQLVAIMGKEDIEMINTLSSIIKSPFIELKHIMMLPVDQQVDIYEYAKKNGIEINDDIRQYFYEITGDISMLPDKAKDVFMF